MPLDTIIDTNRHPIADAAFRRRCAGHLERDGVLALADFLRPASLAQLQAEAAAARQRAYFCTQDHNVYLTTPDPHLPPDHVVNRTVTSSKGCICDDDVAPGSPLRVLYDAPAFRDFVRAVTGQAAVHPYADPLSSINVHYAERGQELGWHFDNSSFAITLLIQAPEAGGRFEYLKDVRDDAAGAPNHAGVADLLDGRLTPDVLEMEAGTLVLFRGRHSIHRVTPNEGARTRMLAVLAYNAEPGIALSERARMTFYGRLA